MYWEDIRFLITKYKGWWNRLKNSRQLEVWARETSLPGLLPLPNRPWFPPLDTEATLLSLLNHHCHGYESNLICICLCHSFKVEVPGRSIWLAQAGHMPSSWCQRDERGNVSFHSNFLSGRWGPTFQWGIPHKEDMNSDAGKPKCSNCTLQSC